MTKLDEMIQSLELTFDEEIKRDYNYRKIQKRKEQNRRKEIYEDYGYFPTMPYERIDEKGNSYYVEGSKSNLLKILKKEASKRVRNHKNNIPKGGDYKKVYDLPWIWY